MNSNFEKIADFQGYKSTLVWRSPKVEMPENGNFVIFLSFDEEYGYLAEPGSYERGHFWATSNRCELIPTEEIEAWTYFPFDGR